MDMNTTIPEERAARATLAAICASFLADVPGADSVEIRLALDDSDSTRSVARLEPGYSITSFGGALVWNNGEIEVASGPLAEAMAVDDSVLQRVDKLEHELYIARDAITIGAVVDEAMTWTRAGHFEILPIVDHDDRVRAAIERTRKVDVRQDGSSYWTRTLAQRAGLSPNRMGSTYPGVSPDALDMIVWSGPWMPYAHPSVMPGCSAFIAPLPGHMGVVSLSSLAATDEVILDDPKGTGELSCTRFGDRGPIALFTVLILGLEAGEEVVFTFHAGDPVPYTIVPIAGRRGQRATVSEAIAMGLHVAKVVPV